MSNGLFNHPEQHSCGGKKPLTSSSNGKANERIFIEDDSVAPDQGLEGNVEMSEKLSIIDALEAATAAESPIMKRREHVLQRIEVRCEAKRLNALLREV